jgi:hypothetical protein
VTATDPYVVAEAMQQHGGSFVRSLAECWAKADPSNRAKLESAFEDLFERYRQIVEEMAGAK